MASKAAVLEIYEDIGMNPFTGQGVSASMISKLLKEFGNVDAIDIFLDSPGGSAFEGINIYNQLKRHPAQKRISVDGIAASAASLILMAGDRITMAQNSFIMIHNAWGWAMGFAKDMRAEADVLDKISDQIGQTYIDRTGLDPAKIKELMDAETWMTAEEAAELGFAHFIDPNKTARAYADVHPFGYARVPDRVAANIRPRGMTKYSMNLALNKARVQAMAR